MANKKRSKTATRTAETPSAVVGYLRVSSDEQAQHGFGLRAQEAKVRAYCEALGKPLSEIVCDDGWSGGSLDRPGLQVLLERIRAGEVGAVVVAKLDRLSRSLADLLTLHRDVFEQHGAALVSVAEQFDTSTASGKLFFQIVGGFAEFERNVITERTSGGRREKARKGGYAGGGAPFGYAAQRGSHVLYLDERAAEAVRRVFELRDEGLTQREIAERLNAEGFKTAQGKEFRNVQVMRILRRRDLYEGRYTYAGVEADKGEQPGILDPSKALGA